MSGVLLRVYGRAARCERAPQPRTTTAPRAASARTLLIARSRPQALASAPLSRPHRSRVRTALASAPLARVRCELAHGICVCMRRVHVCSRFCVCSAVQSQSIHRPYLVQSACNGIDLARSHFITFRIVSHYIRSRQLAVSTGGADYIRCNWRALHTLQWAFFRCNALHRLALCNIVCYIRCSVAEPAHFGFQ